MRERPPARVDDRLVRFTRISHNPHGIDFVPELVELAKQRLPQWTDNFELANVFYWEPQRRYRFVQMLLESVPKDDQPQLVRRLLRDAVGGGGRLIVPIYGLGDAAKPEVARVSWKTWDSRSPVARPAFRLQWPGSTSARFDQILDNPQVEGSTTGQIRSPGSLRYPTGGLAVCQSVAC